MRVHVKLCDYFAAGEHRNFNERLYALFLYYYSSKYYGETVFDAWRKSTTTLDMVCTKFLNIEKRWQ